MRNKKQWVRQTLIKGILPAAILITGFSLPAFADDNQEYIEYSDTEQFEMEYLDTDYSEMDYSDMEAIANYEVDESLFQQITDLEQEKILMQLEKERAQLDLDLDRLAAEKIKLHMEIDTLSGRAEEQQMSIESERAKLEADVARLEKERESPANQEVKTASKKTANVQTEVQVSLIADSYRLVDIIGAGNQLQATIESLVNGQRKKISVGKKLDEYDVKSISLDDGVVFIKDGETQTLNIGKID